MNTHIDTLAEWWNEATLGIPKTGDTYIEDERHQGRSFRIVKAPTDHKYGFDNIRILARAPKPKPAWHDAVAVIAETTLHHRRVWVREGDGTYSNTEGEMADDYELHDVTPLIEAKVTDEMRARAIAAYEDDHGSFAARIDATLAAALGIEAE